MQLWSPGLSVQQIGHLINGMSFLHDMTTSVEPVWILGTKKLKNYFLCHKHGLSQMITGVWNCSVILEEKVLVHIRSYLKCLLRKEGRKYLDNKLKLSFSKVILVVTFVCQTFPSLNEPHLIYLFMSTILSPGVPLSYFKHLASIKTSLWYWYIFWRAARNIKYERSLSLIVLCAKLGHLIGRPRTPKVHLSGKMPSVAATPAPLSVHRYTESMGTSSLFSSSVINSWNLFIC